MAILLLTTFLRDFLKKRYNNSDLMDGWHAYILFLVAIILISMLVSKENHGL